MNSSATTQSELNDAIPANMHGSGTGNYVLDQTAADFTFGVQEQHAADLMDFMFDPITSPGNNNILAAMQAIQNTAWWRNMMVPGLVVPHSVSHRSRQRSSAPSLSDGSQNTWQFPTMATIKVGSGHGL